MPHHILHLLGTAQLEGTGVARIVAATVAGLDPSRYRVSAWFLGADGPLASQLRISGAEVRVMKWLRGARDPVGAWRFWRSLRDENFVIVHQHYGGRSISWLVRMATRSALVIQLHGRVLEPQTHPLRVADAVIAVSQSVARQVQHMPPRVVYPGAPISDSVFTGSATGRVLGAACRLVTLKGIVYLIRALAYLRDEFPDLRLQIAGAGPELPALEREVSSCGLKDAVTFLGWQADLEAWYAGWDIFVQPSLDEGLPIAVLEAMAAGLPVVATAVGGTAELVAEGRTGWLVPPRDSAALAQRIRALLLNPEQRRAMGAAAQVRVQDNFSVDQMVGEFSRIYLELLMSKAPCRISPAAV
jgi:glycosyltransferase involved in cell wall biosynthesis